MQLRNISFTENSSRKILDENALRELLGGDFAQPIFPNGTTFVFYENHIPVAHIPLANGGSIVRAFDTFVPRPFPCGLFVKNSEFCSLEEFMGFLRVLERK